MPKFIPPIYNLFSQLLKDFENNPSEILKQKILLLILENSGELKGDIYENKNFLEIKPDEKYWALPVTLNRELKKKGYTVKVEYDDCSRIIDRDFLAFELKGDLPAYFHLIYKDFRIFTYTHILIKSEQIYNSPYSVQIVMNEEMEVDPLKLDVIARLIAKWNENIPIKYHIHTLYLRPNSYIYGCYNESRGTISISLGCLESEVEQIVLIHELAHREYDWRLKEIQSFELDKGSAYTYLAEKYISISNTYYSYLNKRVKGSNLINSYLAESTYWIAYPSLGHPEDNLNELFASYKNILFWKRQELEYQLFKLKVLCKDAWLDIMDILISIDEFCLK